MNAIPETSWHLDEELARCYAAGRLAPVPAASVEQHLLACAGCRALVGPAVDPGRLDAVWESVREVVTTPRTTMLERLLRRLGIDASDARLVAATPTLRGAWLTAMAVVLGLALVAGYADPHGVAVFFALAPVLPVAGVALAFGPASDPAHEMTAAAPYPAARLVAVRTVFVLTATLPAACAAGLLLPGSPWLALAWLLPALALVLGTLALAARVELRRAAAAVAVGWSAVVLPGLAPGRNPLLASEPTVQVLSLAAAAVALLYLAGHRRDLPDLLRSIR